MFLTTSSMLITTPGAIIAVPGISYMRYMSFLGLFLFKDIISLGVSLYLISHFGKKSYRYGKHNSYLGKSYLRKVILSPWIPVLLATKIAVIELGRFKALVASVCRKDTTPLAQRIHLVRLHRFELASNFQVLPKHGQ
jgi:hypothetical protein